MRILRRGHHRHVAARSLSRRGVGRTFQTLQVFVKLSVRDNLIVAAQEFKGTLASRLFATPDAGLGEHADEMIELFRLQHVATLPAGNLSYGQQKLIDIAMAFMPAPRLVLLDEPCAGRQSGPASTSCASCWSGSTGRRAAASSSSSTTWTSSCSLCPHVICMVEGKVMAEGTPAAVSRPAGARGVPRELVNAYSLETYLGQSVEISREECTMRKIIEFDEGRRRLSASLTHPERDNPRCAARARSHC